MKRTITATVYIQLDLNLQRNYKRNHKETQCLSEKILTSNEVVQNKSSKTLHPCSTNNGLALPPKTGQNRSLQEYRITVRGRRQDNT